MIKNNFEKTVYPSIERHTNRDRLLHPDQWVSPAQMRPVNLPLASRRPPSLAFLPDSVILLNAFAQPSPRPPH